MNECFCGSQAFRFDSKHETATCVMCRLVWCVDNEGEILSPLLPEAYTQNETKQEIVSVIDIMLT